MPCVAVSHPLCVVWIWMFLTKKYNKYSLLSSLNDKKLVRTFQVLSVFFTFDSVSRSTFLLYICKCILIAMNWCFVLFFTGFVSPLCVLYLYFVLLALSVLFANYAVFLQLLRLFVVEAGWDESCVKSNNHLHCSILKSPFGGIWLWWMSDVVFTTSKSLHEETLAFTQCALKWKREVTPP